MRNKTFRIVAIVCILAMMLSLAACGSSAPASTGTAGDSGEAAKSYDQVTFAYATFNNIPTAENLAPVEEAINVITREKIGVEVKLMPISIADYSSKVSLGLQGGEKIDIFESLGNYGTCVAGDMAYDITELVEQYAAGTKEILGDEIMSAARVNGKLYGIPTYKPFALTPMLIYRQDIADELGLDIDSLQDVFGVTEILRAVKEAKPDMTPLAPVSAGTIGLNMCMGDVDWLSDDYYSPVGVLLNDELTAVDLYSSDNFRNIATLARTWHDEGLVMKDAATTTTMAAEAMTSGNYFGYIAAYSYPEADTAASLEAQCGGFPIGAKILDGAYLSTGDINALTWMVASTTKVPEAAVKFLDLTFTDDEVINLIIYGLKDRDYVLNEDGTVSYPEGQDSTTVPYTAQLSCGTMGNFFKMYPMAGTDPESLKWEEEQNREAKKSPAMGFTFDAGELKTQYTAVRNVINQYLPGLICGSLDPETEIDNFVKALNDAGYQDILSAKQAQLDTWLANK